jgi:diguanylate cyclase (GGDEF)-like protein/PAS domain S-box-containing protein
MIGREASSAEGILIAAFEQVVDAVVVVDHAGRIAFFNAAAERLWGCDRDDVLGADVAVCLPQLARGPLASGGSPRTSGAAAIIAEEIIIERCDGSTAVGAMSLSPVGVGGATVYAAFVRDATAGAHAREELRLLSMATNETDRAVVLTDADRKILYVNKAFCGMFGYSRAEAIGRDADDIFAGRNARHESLTRFRRLVESGKSFHEDLFVCDKNGVGKWIYAAVNPIFETAGTIGNVVAVFSDINENKQVQFLQRDVLEAVASDMPLTEVMNLICQRVEAIAPEVICSILAVDDERRLRPLAGPSLPAHVATAIDGIAIGPSVGSCGTAAWRGTPVIVTDIETDPLWTDFKALALPLGLLACWSSPIKLRDGHVAGTFAFYYKAKRGPSPWHEHIVTACIHLCVLAIERHQAKAHIARLAYYDTLTGLPNRLRLRERIHALITAEGRPGHSAFLFLDIDRFKDVNDTLGHSVGDRLLVEIARRLQVLLGADDVVSRYGGDEFVIMVADCGAEHAGGLATKIIESLLAPVGIENMLLPVSASLGISIYPDDGRDEDSLLKHADTAMYQAKSAGGGTFRFFSPEMNSVAQERLVLGAALREAITRGQLRLHYQPQIDCHDGRLRGVEALARWNHPAFGDVSPARFIALAEECGLIEAIGQWALDESCRQLAAWHRQGIDVPSISVNLSAVHFRNRELAGLVAEALRRHKLQPSMLTIEITEGVMMDDNPATTETAKAIHALGVNLSLDDFGTGYSSLSHLARLPINELKIDRSFMHELECNKNAQAVVTAVIKIGQSLGLTVVAEGVETAAQRQFLAALECDLLQGFLFSRALAPADFEAWVAKWMIPKQAQLSGAA